MIIPWHIWGVIGASRIYTFYNCNKTQCLKDLSWRIHICRTYFWRCKKACWPFWEDSHLENLVEIQYFIGTMKPCTAPLAEWLQVSSVSLRFEWPKCLVISLVTFVGPCCLKLYIASWFTQRHGALWIGREHLSMVESSLLTSPISNQFTMFRSDELEPLLGWLPKIS